MGIQGLQDYIEKHCPGAVVPVELQRLARGISGGVPGAPAVAGGGGGGGVHTSGQHGRSRGPLTAPSAAPPLSGQQQHHHQQHHHQQPSPGPLRLLVDAENCLGRLYGGFFTDWVSGGQWNQMLGFLAALSRSCAQANIELVVFFSGALEKGRLPEWTKRQACERHTAQQIVAHVQSKGTPPPKVWFIPPVGLAHFIRLALLRFRVKVCQSINDHHLEVIRFCKESGFHGLVAQDSDYAIFCPPHYFSSSTLKLSRNGKSLTANEYLVPEAACALQLQPHKFPIFAALLGNHLLPDEDLAAFHWNLLGPEHPLASLKVRAHQLVLPPCDVVIKAVAEYLKNVSDINDLDSIAKDVFKHSQSQRGEKIERFKKAVQYYTEGHKTYPRPSVQSTNLPGAALFPVPLFPTAPVHNTAPSYQQGDGPPQQSDAQSSPQTANQDSAASPAGKSPSNQAEACYQADLNDISEDNNLALDATLNNSLGAEDHGYGNIGSPATGKHTPLYERASPIAPAVPCSPRQTTGPSPPPSSPSSTSSDNGDAHGDTATANHINELPESGGRGPWAEGAAQGGGQGSGVAENGGGQAACRLSVADEPSCRGGVLLAIPSLMSTPTRAHMDLTTPPRPQVAVEVIRVAEYRHRNGLMHPGVYQVLTTGELKLPVTLEDEANPELPPATLLYRPARQHVYGVLFSLGELRKRALRRAPPGMMDTMPVLVKEWCAYKGKAPQTPELVEALPFREWTCPTLRKLWLGKAVEDKNRRMRAFLACLRSDTPGMVNPAAVPTQHLVLCCVLRYMLQCPGGRILRRHELDAFLAQAVSPMLYKPEQLQEIKIDGLDARGVQLAALFMRGVETALFANDACGQPVPWEHCCPWLYFDGKLFQSKLLRATRDRAPLLEICDGQSEQVSRVDRMRQSILEGLNLSRPPMPPLPPPMPPPPPYLPPSMMGQYPHHPPPQGLYLRAPGPPLMPPPSMHPRARNIAGGHALPQQGGKLEIAGMVVGQWAGGRRGRARGILPPQIVSVGCGMRGRGGRGAPSTRGPVGVGRGGGKPAREEQNGNAAVATAAAAASSSDIQESQAEPPPRPDQSGDGAGGDSAATKPIGCEDGAAIASDGNQSESALMSDSAVCNTGAFLNAHGTRTAFTGDSTSATIALSKEE